MADSISGFWCVSSRHKGSSIRATEITFLFFFDTYSTTLLNGNPSLPEMVLVALGCPNRSRASEMMLVFSPIAKITALSTEKERAQAVGVSSGLEISRYPNGSRASEILLSIPNAKR
jgi:hypothetical protein